MMSDALVRRFYAPERDMKLVRKINPHPETWADFPQDLRL